MQRMKQRQYRSLLTDSVTATDGILLIQKTLQKTKKVCLKSQYQEQGLEKVMTDGTERKIS